MKAKLLALAAAVLVTTGAVGARAGSAFDLFFDDAGGSEPEGTLSPPFTGVGQFISADALTPGVYALSSLSGFSFNAFFADGESFTASDIKTPLSQVAVNVFLFGPAQVEAIEFTENGSPADGGPFVGSLDFVNGDGAGLTFEPTYAGGNYEYQEFPSGFFGNYLGLAAPEPATWGLMLIGVAGIGAALRGRRRARPAAA